MYDEAYDEDKVAARSFYWCPDGIFGGNRGIASPNDRSRRGQYLNKHKDYFERNKYSKQDSPGPFIFTLGMDYPITRFYIYANEPGNSPRTPVVAAWAWDNNIDQVTGEQPKYCIWYGDNWGNKSTFWFDRSPDGKRIPDFPTAGLKFNSRNKSFTCEPDQAAVAPYWDAWKKYVQNRDCVIARALAWRSIFPLP